ncbi:MAG: MBOAT family protein [Lachnospiraceae bacterium]|nr:MBOAT family protein [Lachnospiraceae bacterium]
MLFNSYIFVFLFLPLVVMGYYGLHHFGWQRAALGYLTMMSMVFYGYNSMAYLAMLIVSILVNFFLVRFMGAKSGRVWQRRAALLLGLLYNLGILFYFKYYDFFIENVNAAFKTDYRFLRLALPLGISFYTFQQISYVIDAYRGDCERYSFLEYAAYVSFFPQLIAGPIVYHDELIPQLRAEENHHIQFENLSKGIYAFALGMAKKVLVADTLSKVVTAGYADVEALNSVSTMLVMVCYSLQIYFDFSGYCDMAYGIGFLFNVTLPINFNSPYKAASIREFWDRWHMTLTRFFTKYIYIPLGGSRRGTARTYFNVMVVFLVSGIWHGANWTFILWGVVNGFGNLFDRVFGRVLMKIPRLIRVFFTFCFCSIAWSMFRAQSLKQGFLMIKNLGVAGDGRVYGPLTEVFDKLVEVKLLGWMGLDPLIQACPWLMPAVFAAVLVCACLWMRSTQDKAADGRYGIRRIVTTVGLLIWSILSLSEVSEFLYFNF